MASPIQNHPAFEEAIAVHRQWLDGFNPIHRRLWERNYKGDYESGLAEALVRIHLKNQGVDIVPNAAIRNEKSPDFRCSFQGKEFYVEATCVQIGTAENRTSLPYPTDFGTARNYASLNIAVSKKCRAKAEQCDSPKKPTLLAIGCFHAEAAILSFRFPHLDMMLTGTTYITTDFDPKRGTFVGESYQTTQVKDAVFLNRKDDKIKDARESISGILLYRFGCEPPVEYGLLNPAARCKFDPSIFHNINFGTVCVRDNVISTSWTKPKGSSPVSENDFLP
jgi:hypothetical protein